MGFLSPRSGIKDSAALAEVVDRMQAVVELTLDGAVVAANDNFVNILGYTLDEVKGRHHRTFCEASFADSPEYQAFWTRLNQGNPESGVFKQIGKGGKEVWFQTTYCPVPGAGRRPVKVIGIATDVTRQRQEIEDLKEELQVRVDIMNTTSIVSEADLKGDIVTTNDKFLQVSKYSKEELIGHGHNTTRHPDMPKEVFKQMWATIGRGQTFAASSRIARRTGRLITWTR